MVVVVSAWFKSSFSPAGSLILVVQCFWCLLISCFAFIVRVLLIVGSTHVCVHSFLASSSLCWCFHTLVLLTASKPLSTLLSFSILQLVWPRLLFGHLTAHLPLSAWCHVMLGRPSCLSVCVDERSRLCHQGMSLSEFIRCMNADGRSKV